MSARHLVRISMVPSHARLCWAAPGPKDGRSTWPECFGALSRFSVRYVCDGSCPPPKDYAHIKLYRRVSKVDWVHAPRLEKRAYARTQNA